MNQVATNILGRHVYWFGDKGREGGPIVAVGVSEQGYFMVLVVIDGKLQQKSAHGLYLE